jgi:hypothetical protein
MENNLHEEWIECSVGEIFTDRKGIKPTVGIILCTEKSKTVVKYYVMNDSPQLFATKYLPFLPSEAELIAEIEREKRLLQIQNY